MCEDIDYSINEKKTWYWFKLNDPDKHMEITVEMFTIPWKYDTVRMKRNCCISLKITNKSEPICEATYRYNEDELAVFGILADTVRSYNKKLGNNIPQVMGILTILEEYENDSDNPFHNVNTMLSTIDCIVFIKDYFYNKKDGRLTRN